MYTLSSETLMFSVAAGSRPENVGNSKHSNEQPAFDRRQPGISEDAMARAALKDHHARVVSAPKKVSKKLGPMKPPPSSIKQVEVPVIKTQQGQHNLTFPSAVTSSCKHDYGPALHDCDYWVRTQGNTCSHLATENGFNCEGCLCDTAQLVISKGCIDYGGELHSCEYWMKLNVGQTCKELEDTHGFDCSGCRCNR